MANTAKNIEPLNGHHSVRIDLIIRKNGKVFAVAEVKNNSHEIESAIKHQLLPAMGTLSATQGKDRPANNPTTPKIAMAPPTPKITGQLALPPNLFCFYRFGDVRSFARLT
ncbi:8226_t:CDS:2, partial [Racocetra persica]